MATVSQNQGASRHENRPQPTDPERAAEWQETARRVRMLIGRWFWDAEDRLAAEFHPDAQEFLPPATIAYNLFAALVDQTSSLYDGDVRLEIRGRRPRAADVEMLDAETLWAIMMDVLRFVRGLNECYVRRGWRADTKTVTYLPVTPDFIESEATGPDPSQPNLVRHLALRLVPSIDEDSKAWTWAEWDLRDPQNPRYAILAQLPRAPGASGVVDEFEDVTLELVPELINFEGRWPFWTGGPTGGGDPIWPWTLYHHRITHTLHEPWRGHEAVDATLLTAALWTFWVGGLKDASFLARWLMDAEVAGASTTNGVGKGTPYIPMIPQMVMQLTSSEVGTKGTAGAWDGSFDPEKSANAISGWAAQAAQHLGLSAADVTVGNSTGLSRTSSVAIEVSRAGRRQIEGKLRRPMTRGDQHNLSHAAMMANAFGGARLPVEPKAYNPIYARTEMTVGEMSQLIDGITRLDQQNLIDPADALRKLEPHLTQEEAVVKALRIRALKRSLEMVSAGELEPTDDRVPDGALELVDSGLPETPSTTGEPQ